MNIIKTLKLRLYVLIKILNLRLYVLKSRIFQNTTSDIINKLYFTMIKKYEGLNDENPHSRTMDFLRLCDIQKVRKHLWSNKVDVWLMHPGIFIGKAGTTIDWIQEHTGFKIKLYECRKRLNPVQEAIANLCYFTDNW